MNWLKKLAGLVVGKFVLRAQLLPIGELKGLRWLWSKLHYSQARIKQLNNIWPDFVAKNTEYKKKAPEKAIEISRQFFTTEDGSQLDTVELYAPQNKAAKQYVIYGWGRSDCYEFFLPRLANDALNLNKKIISFNFRNVGHSKGQVYHEHDLVRDYKFQVKRLLDKGVDPKNITCYGHSLCGAIAAFAVKELHQEGYPVKLYSDRSFSNLMNTSIHLFFKPERRIRRAIVTAGTLFFGTLLLGTLALLGIIAPLNALIAAGIGFTSLWVPPIFSLFDKSVGWVLEKALYGIMIYGEWVMDVAKTYDAIPAKDKMHTVLRTADKSHSPYLGERKKIAPGYDKVILYPDSLHHHLPSQRRQKINLKDRLHKALENGDKRKALQYKKQLSTLSNSKMTGGHHTAWPHEMYTRYKTQASGRWLTGQEHFYAFVEPNGVHDKPKAPRYRKFQ
ncbi:hypothetical protein [Candidatus Berkiella aquae]|uniref:Alpha/beta hydrolase family protein n=1 Tax=Candidatus Berkiella aquae TaxID=295108 RepID=A0A0Q9YZS0_9GAMM|nr:hypothetical protein [Candidatus Berkiella aquae]MCS5712141.1 hypothetical protein [Candidatus Berkiella aquae]